MEKLAFSDRIFSPECGEDEMHKYLAYLLCVDLRNRKANITSKKRLQQVNKKGIKQGCSSIVFTIITEKALLNLSAVS